jgi:hypothetical protein
VSLAWGNDVPSRMDIPRNAQSGPAPVTSLWHVERPLDRGFAVATIDDTLDGHVAGGAALLAG